jgi:2-dehydro-3-deoxyglucarate aldolase/4-hydroxy-2-oxoheptanedioate aldolase
MSTFRQRVRNRETLVGPLLTLAAAQVAEIFALLGFDWAWIDLEHTPLELEQVQHMVQAMAGRMGSIVRVPWNDPVHIKRALDVGIDGVLVPQVKTAEEARRAVASAKYPPAGLRSVGIARSQQYGLTLQDYVLKANDTVTVMLQVEHIDAAAKIEEIVDVPGVDAIVFGPYDLSASMGLPGQVAHPDVASIITRLAETCNQRRMPWGAFCPDAEAAKRLLDRGATVIALATDTMHLWRGARAALETLRPRSAGI